MVHHANTLYLYKSQCHTNPKGNFKPNSLYSEILKKKFCCPISDCGRTYIRISDLRSHFSTYHPNKVREFPALKCYGTFFCFNCGLNFARKRCLQTHKKYCSIGSHDEIQIPQVSTQVLPPVSPPTQSPVSQDPIQCPLVLPSSPISPSVSSFKLIESVHIIPGNLSYTESNNSNKETDWQFINIKSEIAKSESEKLPNSVSKFSVGFLLSSDSEY